MSDDEWWKWFNSMIDLATSDTPCPTTEEILARVWYGKGDNDNQ